MKPKGTRSLSACAQCRKAKIKCTNFDHIYGCDECAKRQLKCIMDPYRKKRGPKPKKSIQFIPTSQLSNTISFDSRVPELKEAYNFENNIRNVQLSEVIPTLSNRCISCTKGKKLCKGGVPGHFKCERCQKKGACIFQCTACYKKNKDKKDQFPQCNNCKVIMGDSSENISSKYDIFVDVNGQKSYLRHYNCNHEVEITSALLDAMINSYKTINPTYKIPTCSTDDLSELPNIYNQIEESYVNEIDLTSAMDTSSPHFNFYYPVNSLYENTSSRSSIVNQFNISHYAPINTHFNTFTNDLSLTNYF